MTSICATCCIQLRDDEHLRQHYRGELHSVNLKRRVADLPPVSQSDVDKHAAVAAAEAARKAAADVPCVFLCDACGKSFGTESQMDMHVKSRTHVKRVKEILAEQRAAAISAAASMHASEGAVSASRGEGVPESKDEDAPAPGDEDGAETHVEEILVSAENCVFCFHKSEDVPTNLEHMRVKHSFFVPDMEFLRNPDGLIEYLLEQVVSGKCVFCASAKVYDTPQAVQQHMVDRSHCKVRYETDADLDALSEFYDYTDASSDDEEAEAEEAAKVADGRIVIHTAAGTAYRTPAGDLELPSGRIARNRMYTRYYKQYFAPRPEGAGLPSKMDRLLLEYKSSGVSTSTALALARQAALGMGARGNRVDMVGQRSSESYLRRKELHTGMQMNQIRRKYFRVAFRQ